MRILALLFIVNIALFANVDKIENYTDNLFEDQKLNGNVLVAYKNKIIFQKSYGYANSSWKVKFENDTRFLIFSLTKHVTAIMIMQLVDEGKLELYDTIDNYLPYLPGKKKNISILNLLTHTHGIPDLYYEDLPLNIDQLSKERFIQNYFDDEREFSPGKEFSYSELAGYSLLGAIIEEITGKSYEENLKERIIEKLSLLNSGFFDGFHDVGRLAEVYQFDTDYLRRYFFTVSFNGSSSIYSSTEDLLRIETGIDNNDLMSKVSKEILLTAVAPKEKPKYALGYYIEDIFYNGRYSKARYHTGGGRSSVYHVEDEGISIILLNNIRNDKLIDYSREILMMIK
ncbi:MAG: beta-lactamase family protein [Candidatus Delongbacteria bacterium]|nr:beta-lactamase family protein [Candidatus Delongbacteria bacterium]MBN2834023.1 beta-lactamase family protein [Candidatus Delongbacteria bacterium]